MADVQSGNKKPRTFLRWLTPKRNVVDETVQQARHNAKAISFRLVQDVARRVRISPDQVDVRAPLASYGIDSRAAIALSGDLGTWLGRELSPILVFEYPSIEAIAETLEAQLAPSVSKQPAPPA